MAIGMKFHHFADPKPPSPNFRIVIPSRLSPRGGTFRLVFYVPEGYVGAPDGYRFPVVVNYHGGGFTLGTGTDDARWAAAVLHNVNAVFVSVEYRLAPEYPFSTGVEDGTDALMYLAAHAEELRLDPHQMALSGFSAGANFAFTVPLMFYDLQNHAGKRNLLECNDKHNRAGMPKSSSTLSLPRPISVRSHSSTRSVVKLTDFEPTALELEQKIPDLTIRALVSFYPTTDFRQTRDEKRATNPKPKLNLPPMLATLFDESYISESKIDVTDPYLSPAAAPSDLLKAAYPEDIILYTCEYDMLNKEGVEFGERLAGRGIEKTLHGGLIKGVPHAFDKKPNPLKFPKEADRCYNEACSELKRVFGGSASIEERRLLDMSLGVERYDNEHVEEEQARLMGKGKRREYDPPDGEIDARLNSHYQNASML